MKTEKIKEKCPRCGKYFHTSELRAVLDLIVSSSGCDGSDDFARGWDEACSAIYEAVERMNLCDTK